VNIPAPSLEAGSQLHQAEIVPVIEAASKMKWKVITVGDKWGAMQPLAGPVWWLRLFDSFQLANDFVQAATAKASVTK
jgi:hypothetical protein